MAQDFSESLKYKVTLSGLLVISTVIEYTVVIVYS